MIMIDVGERRDLEICVSSISSPSRKKKKYRMSFWPCVIHVSEAEKNLKLLINILLLCDQNVNVSSYVLTLACRSILVIFPFTFLH